VEVWLNPECSKCRAAVSMLDSAGAEYTVRRYLEDPPTPAELSEVLTRLGLEPWDITRTGEPVAAELGIGAWPRDPASRQLWIATLAAQPILIQRPIITADDGTTVVGRSEQALWSVLVPADPATRPRRTRSTVRVLVIDDRDRLLLLQDSDRPAQALWWMLPGGGIDPGETELGAVVREIAEETGYVVAPGTVLGPIARRHVVHGYSDQVVDQDEAFYALRVPQFEVSVAGHTEEEQRTLVQHRWWSRAELETAEDEVWPANLAAVWDLVERPRAWPRALPTVEESTVAVDATVNPGSAGPGSGSARSCS
jgi:arsenate reductase (glutaredoxin)